VDNGWVPAALTSPSFLAADEWRQRRAEHEQRVDALVGEHLDRRRTGVKHPVADFLFTYYSYRPAQLRRWHPGAGVVLEDADPSDLGPEYVIRAPGATLDVATIRERRGSAIDWIRELLEATASRPPHFGCFGMHEWAMVYDQDPDEVRHRDWPLRLDPAGVLAQNRVRCSHFDAFRFFTPAARPLNLLQPTRESQLANEQPGCLHANMDVYRWAYKLSPLVPSDLVADCFELAQEIRTLDMRASPYDLTELGLDPVRVETAEGRADYGRRQRDFANRAAVLRRRLIDRLSAD
jgi:hypothetical protein